MVDTPKHNFVRIASSAAVKATAGKVYRYRLVGGSANSTFKLTNDANGSGTAVIDGSALALTVDKDSFEDSGPIVFSTAIYATVAGTGAVLYLWYD